MVVSSETVINKMMDEINAAGKSIHNKKEMIEHISNIKLLSELLLDEYENKDKGFTEEKPNQNTLMTDTHVKSKFTPTHKIDDKDGTSIFDF